MPVAVLCFDHETGRGQKGRQSLSGEPGVARLAGPVQQGTGAAANVEHGPGGHHQSQVEPKVGTLLPSAEGIVERRETRFGELPVDHRTSLSAKTQSRIPAILLPVDALMQTRLPAVAMMVGDGFDG